VKPSVLQNLSQMEEALEREGLAPKPLAPLLHRVREHLARYTRLERELAGGVGVSFPLHLLEEEEPVEPERRARLVAARERERLELGEGPVGGMRTLLEGEGLKMYLPPFPDGSGLLGFCLFDEEAGPVFVADGDLDPDRLDFVLAQLYGHFLLDHDPYSIRLVRTEPDAADPVSARARLFGTLFLVSPEGLARYLVALGWKQGDPLSAATVRELALFFEMAPERFLERVEELGFPAPPTVERGGVTPDPPPAPAELPEAGAVSERFLRLALEAHARGLLDEAELARHLETDRRGARRLAARFRFGDDDEEGILATPEDDE